MSEDRKAIDKLLKEIDLMIKEVDTEIYKIKANAYGARIQDNYYVQDYYYVIELRDEFNKLYGQYDALLRVKNKILEIIDEGVSVK